MLEHQVARSVVGGRRSAVGHGAAGDGSRAAVGDGARGAEQGPVTVRAVTARLWLAGARPRTLPAAVVPVAVGAAAAWWSWRHRLPARLGCAALCPGAPHAPVWWRVAAALVVALAVQIGTNYANDYSDGLRGTDRQRVGPVRLVGQDLAAPAVVRRAALVAFAVAGAAGLALAAAAGWWLLAVGAACLVAGWTYTGGPRPYGYLGLGEVFVFVFFGLVATVGTTYVVVGTFPAVAVVGGVITGLLACALLEANNVRDADGDRVAGKRTLAVRLGRSGAGWLYVGSLAAAGLGVVALAAAWAPWAALALLAVPVAVPGARVAVGPGGGAALLPVLAATGRLQLMVGALLTAGLLVGALWR